MRNLFYLFFIFFTLNVSANEDAFRYRIVFKDKGGDKNIKKNVPQLSEVALAKRYLWNIQIDSTDYPIYKLYTDVLNKAGYKIVTSSRWMNSVVVSATADSLSDFFKTFRFVKDAKLVWVAGKEVSKTEKKKSGKFNALRADSSNVFGKTLTQNNLLGIPPLHSAGYRGKGVMIALLDAGFLNADSSKWFTKTNILACKDFIYPPSSIFDGHYHGSAVLSTLAADSQFVYTGIAPESDYLLLRTEDVDSEFPIEEDYWAAAIEFADSMGVDIVSSSLGYNRFDSLSMSYNQSQLDGKTAFISKVAAMAVNKGLLVVCSAGNDGNNSWKKISFPADVDGVLSVGSVNSSNQQSSFSSIGPSSDGRIKPDVVAMGGGTSIIDPITGNVKSGSGTSYSAPLVSGLAACIKQAFPALSSKELIQEIIKSGDKAEYPDSLYGFGMPNAYKIWLSLSEYPLKKDIPDWFCYPNPADNRLYIANFSGADNKIKCLVYDLTGKKIKEDSFNGQYHMLDLSGFAQGIYVVTLVNSGKIVSSNKIQIRRK